MEVQSHHFASGTKSSPAVPVLKDWAVKHVKGYDHIVGDEFETKIASERTSEWNVLKIWYLEIDSILKDLMILEVYLYTVLYKQEGIAHQKHVRAQLCQCQSALRQTTA